MKEKNSVSKSASIDMLNGAIFKKLLLFSLPLIASGVLQQSFYAIDVAVVGRFASRQALAAVGGNNMVVSIMVNLFIGISIGANVVIANYIGRKNDEGVRRAASSVALLSIISGVALTLIGLIFSRPILEAMSTPDDVIDLAALYLRIIFLGMPFIMIFNFGAAVLRSVGDTKRPFYMLVVSGVVNTVLNVVLVVAFGMSVEGVAIATFVANVVNAWLMVRVLRREKGPWALVVSDMKLHRTEVAKILRIGLPAGVQGMIFSFANIFVQSSVNSFGSAGVAGSAAAVNYEFYCYFIISAFGQACVAFMGQNYGAGNYDRCRKVFGQSMLLSVVCCGVANFLFYLFREPCVAVFTDEVAVADYAFTRMQWVLLTQFVASSYEISGSALRGLGYSMTPTLITVFGTCVLRLGWVFWIFPANNTFLGLMLVYPASWILTGVAMLAAWWIISNRVLGRRSPAGVETAPVVANA